MNLWAGVYQHGKTYIIDTIWPSLVLKGRMGHFIKWQIRPFNTRLTIQTLHRTTEISTTDAVHTFCLKLDPRWPYVSDERPAWFTLNPRWPYV